LARVDSLNRKVLEAFSKSGCVSMHFGIESGSQKVLDSLNKNQEVEDTVRAFDLCKDFGIKTLADIVIGCPNETREDIEMTDKLLERIRPNWVQVWHLTPYKGTILYDMASEKGWLKHSTLFYDEPQMEINFTFEELVDIQSRLSKKHNKIMWNLRPYVTKKHFVFDMLSLVLKKPSLIFKNLKEWRSYQRVGD